jgi:hypothetical protein
MAQIEVGQVVSYQTWGGEIRKVRVMEVHEDIKRGRPGFDGVVIEGPEKGQPVWGYMDQLV